MDSFLSDVEDVPGGLEILQVGGTGWRAVSMLVDAEKYTTTMRIPWECCAHWDKGAPWNVYVALRSNERSRLRCEYMGKGVYILVWCWGYSCTFAAVLFRLFAFSDWLSCWAWRILSQTFFFNEDFTLNLFEYLKNRIFGR